MTENPPNIDLKQAGIIFNRTLPFIWSMAGVGIAMMLLCLTMSLFAVGLEGFWREDAGHAIPGLVLGYYLWRFTHYIFRQSWQVFDRSNR